MLNNYVLVKIDDKEQKTDEGMYIAKSEGERTEAVAIRAIVVLIPEVAIFNDSKEWQQLEYISENLKEGDIVYVSKWDKHILAIGSTIYATVRLKDIMLKLK